MPRLDGWQTLERIRDVTDVPVLMLTARDDELEKVRGLRGGADDYVTKPFGRQELLARVEALLRRRAARRRPARDVRRRARRDRLAQRGVSRRRQRVRSRRSSSGCCSRFVRHPSQVLSRDQLLELVWGDTSARAATR